MLTTRYIRDNIDAIKASLAKRRSDYPLDELMELDKRWRGIATELQKLQAERNAKSMQVSKLKKEGKTDEAQALGESLRGVKEKIDVNEKLSKDAFAEMEALLWRMPNILHDSVPYGKDDSENTEMRKVGEIGTAKSTKSHEEVLRNLGLVDLDQAAKVSGARFFYLKGDLALLEQALIRFAIDQLVAKGYTLIAPPLMMKREYYNGVTSLGDFEEMLYRVGDSNEASGKRELEHVEDELFMIGTSEHPIAAMHAGAVFSPKELPKKYIGFSPCFRREAGAHGKDTKGIFRVHQFYKVEQFIFSKPEDSWGFHEELLANSEELFQKLKIPYRVVNICTGDIGIVAAKKYDIEAYMPAQEKYREVVSCSNCTDWQAMRLDIRYDEGNERRYVHTLNSTAIATNRAITAIVENYANEDGSITVPDALVQYMGGRTKIG